MIYLDNAATTKPHKFCNEIIKLCNEEFFNPSALYGKALEVSKRLKEARESILHSLRGDGSFIFTSSGTESDNLSIFGCKKVKSGKLIFSMAEHPAVLKAALEMKQKGYNVLFTEVDFCGRVVYDDFLQTIDSNTVLVSIMHVNNETGGINDIKKLCHEAKKISPKVIFHSDGVQALGKIPINLKDLGVDLYSVSAHKIHALKGCGGLFIKNGIQLNPMIFGGGQENGLRSSTENVTGALCFAKAVEEYAKSSNEIDLSVAKVNNIRKYLLDNLTIDGKVMPISDDNCSPYIVSIAMRYVRGEVMLHALEKYNILIGTGSACSSSKKEVKPWKLKNLPDDYKEGILRISFSLDSTMQEIIEFCTNFHNEYSKLCRYIRN